MTSTITTHTLDWRGILIQITFEKWRFRDHLQIESLEPARAPLPITETGYRSCFIPRGDVQSHGGPLEYVAGWLEEASKNKGWIEVNNAARQLSLF